MDSQQIIKIHFCVRVKYRVQYSAVTVCCFHVLCALPALSNRQTVCEILYRYNSFPASQSHPALADAHQLFWDGKKNEKRNKQLAKSSLLPRVRQNEPRDARPQSVSTRIPPSFVLRPSPSTSGAACRPCKVRRYAWDQRARYTSFPFLCSATRMFLFL